MSIACSWEEYYLIEASFPAKWFVSEKKLNCISRNYAILWEHLLLWCFQHSHLKQYIHFSFQFGRTPRFPFNQMHSSYAFYGTALSIFYPTVKMIDKMSRTFLDIWIRSWNWNLYSKYISSLEKYHNSNLIIFNENNNI